MYKHKISVSKLYSKKPIFALFIFLFIFVQDIKSYSSMIIMSPESPQHLGEYLTVCGKAVKLSKLKKRTVINIGQSYPNEDINFLIWDSDIDKFYNKFGNLNNYVNQRMCASGTITSYRNHLQIIVNDPDELYVKK